MEIVEGKLHDQGSNAKPDQTVKEPPGTMDDFGKDYLLSRQIEEEFNSPAFNGIYQKGFAVPMEAVHKATSVTQPQEEVKQNQQPNDAQGVPDWIYKLPGMGQYKPQKSPPDWVEKDPAKIAEAKAGETGKNAGQETFGIEADPWISNPVEMVAGIGGASSKLLYGATKALAPSILRGLSRGVIGATSEYGYGQATEWIGENTPIPPMAFNLAAGMLGGMTGEVALEKLANKAFDILPIQKTPQALARVKQAIINVKEGKLEGDSIAQFLNVAYNKLRDESGSLSTHFSSQVELTLDKPRNLNTVNTILGTVEKEYPGVLDQIKTITYSKLKGEHGETLASNIRLSNLKDWTLAHEIGEVLIQKQTPGLGRGAIRNDPVLEKTADGVAYLISQKAGIKGPKNPGQEYLDKAKTLLQNYTGPVSEKTQSIWLQKLLSQEGSVSIVKKPAPSFQPAAFDLPFKPGVMQEKAVNINLNHIEDSPGIHDALTQVGEVFSQELQEARRFYRSNKTTEAAAAQAETLKLSELIGRESGQAFNAEEALRARILLTSSAQDLVGYAKKAADPLAGPLDKFEFQKALNIHYAIQNQVSGMTAEAGRALQSFRILAKSDLEMNKAISDLVQSTGITGKQGIAELANRIAMLENPVEVGKAVVKAKTASTWDMFVEAWVNGLLSGPTTHIVNTTSNALVAFWQIPERMAAAGWSKLFHDDAIKGAEAMQQAYGMVEGFKDGLKYAGRAIIHNESSDLMTKIETRREPAITAANIAQMFPVKQLQSKLGSKMLEQGGVSARAADLLGEAIRTPGRFLTAEDEVFKTVGYRMELRALSLRQAMNEGLTDSKDIATRMAQIMADPEKLAPEIHMAAIDAARYQTFNMPLGAAGQSFQRTVNSWGPLKVIFPFVRTPANIIKYAMARTPLAALPIKSNPIWQDIMAGGARRDLALGRISMGSMAMASVATLAAQGYITGGGPSDPKEKVHLRNQGWQPYSFHIGDKYYAFGRLEPLGALFGLAADFAEISGLAGEEHQPALDDLAATISASIAKNVTSKTWLKGLSEAVKALDEPDQYAQRWAQNFVGSLVPTASETIERSISPDQEEVWGMVDAMKARIPGLADGLPPRRNLWGEPISYSVDRSKGRTWAEVAYSVGSPVYISQEKNSPVDKELVRLKTGISKPLRTQTFEGIRVKLDPQEYDRLLVLMNETTLPNGMKFKPSMEDIIKQDGYKKAPAEKKILMLQSVRNMALDVARQKMLEENLEMRAFVDGEHQQKAIGQ